MKHLICGALFGGSDECEISG